MLETSVTVVAELSELSVVVTLSFSTLEGPDPGHCADCPPLNPFIFRILPIICELFE